VTDKNWVADCGAEHAVERSGGQDSQGSLLPLTTVGTGASFCSYVHVHCLRVKATYTNIRSASLGADWSFSAWGCWKTCSSQISRHHK
jgi:hypothetical protein